MSSTPPNNKRADLVLPEIQDGSMMSNANNRPVLNSTRNAYLPVASHNPSKFPSPYHSKESSHAGGLAS